MGERTPVAQFPPNNFNDALIKQNAATASELNQLKDGSKPRDFYTEAAFAEKMIDIFNEREESKLKPHPMFGKLSKKQWSDLLVKHFDHHLKQFGV